MTLNNPIAAIGGVGGSGTRVIAQIVNQMGFAFSPDLNTATDTLWATLLFKYRDALDAPPSDIAERYNILKAAMTGHHVAHLLDAGLTQNLLTADRAGQHNHQYLTARLDSLRNASLPKPAHWGWKAPFTHIVIDRLLAAEPELAYIHVVRSGVDMAFSNNQNQLRLWGPMVLGTRFEDTPRGSLRFWRWAHERVMHLSAANPDRVLIIHFETLCRDPEGVIQNIAGFLNLPVSPETLTRLAQNVSPPATIGRHQSRLDELDAGDVAFAIAIERDRI